MPGNPIWDVDNGGKWHINLPDYMGKPGQVLAVNTEGTETIWGEGVSVITPTEDDIGKCIMVDPDLNLIFDKELPDILPGMKNWRLAVKDDESGCEWVEDEKIPVYHHVLKVQNKAPDGKVLSFGYISIYTKYRFLYKDDVSKLVEWVSEEQPDGLTVSMTVVDVDPASYESSKLHVEKVTYTAAGGTLVTNDPPRLGTIDFSTMEELLDPSMYLHKVTLASMAAAPADPLFHMTFNILDYQSDPVDSLTDLKERLRYMGFVTRTSTLSAVGGVSMDYDEETENWNEQYIASGIYEPTIGTMANSLFIAFTKPMDTESKGAIDWFNFENRDINFNDIMTELQGIGSISGGAYLSSEIPDYSIINAKNKLIVNLDGTHLEWLDEPIIPKCGPDDWRKVLTVNEEGDLYWDYADGIAHDIEFPEEFENRKPFILEVDLDDEHPKGLYIHHTPGIIPPGVVRGEYTFTPDINEKLINLLPWPSIPVESSPWYTYLEYDTNFTARGEEFTGIRFKGAYNDLTAGTDQAQYFIEYRKPNGNYIEVYRSYQMSLDANFKKEYGNWVYDEFRTPGASRAYATVNFGADQAVPGVLSDLMNNATSKNEGWWELIADTSHTSSGTLYHDVVFPVSYEPNELFVLDETLSEEYPKGLYRYKPSTEPGKNPDGRFTLRNDLDSILKTLVTKYGTVDFNFDITTDFDGTGTETRSFKGITLNKLSNGVIDPGEIIFKENIDNALRLLPDGDYPVNARSCWAPNGGVYTGLPLSAFRVDKSDPNNMKLWYIVADDGHETDAYSQGAPWNGWCKTTTWRDRIMLDSPITDPLFASFIETIAETTPAGLNTEVEMYVNGVDDANDFLVYYTGNPDGTHTFHGLDLKGKYLDISEQVLSDDAKDVLGVIGSYEHPFDEGYVKGRISFEDNAGFGDAIRNLCQTSLQINRFPVKVIAPALKGTMEDKTFDGFAFTYKQSEGSRFDYTRMGLYKGSGAKEQILWFVGYVRIGESYSYEIVWYVDECKNLDFGNRQYVGNNFSRFIYDYSVTPDTVTYSWDLIADHTDSLIHDIAFPDTYIENKLFVLDVDIDKDHPKGLYLYGQDAITGAYTWILLADHSDGIRHGEEFPTDANDKELFVLEKDIDSDTPEGLYIYDINEWRLLADHRGLKHGIEFPETYEDNTLFVLDVDVDKKHPKGLYLYKSEYVPSTDSVSGLLELKDDIRDAIEAIPAGTYNVNFKTKFVPPLEEWTQPIAECNSMTIIKDAGLIWLEYNDNSGESLGVWNSFDGWYDSDWPWFHYIDFGDPQTVDPNLARFVNAIVKQPVNGQYILLADHSDGLLHGEEFPDDAEIGELFVLEKDIDSDTPEGLYIYDESSGPGKYRKGHVNGRVYFWAESDNAEFSAAIEAITEISGQVFWPANFTFVKNPTSSRPSTYECEYIHIIRTIDSYGEYVGTAIWYHEITDRNFMAFITQDSSYHGWQSNDFRTIDFGEDQIVPEEFSEFIHKWTVQIDPYPSTSTGWRLLADHRRLEHGDQFPTDVAVDTLFVLDTPIGDDYKEGLYILEDDGWKLLADHTDIEEQPSIIDVGVLPSETDEDFKPDYVYRLTKSTGAYEAGIYAFNKGATSANIWSYYAVDPKPSMAVGTAWITSVNLPTFPRYADIVMRPDEWIGVDGWNPMPNAIFQQWETGEYYRYDVNDNKLVPTAALSKWYRLDNIPSESIEVDNVTIEKPNDILQVKERGIDLKHFAVQDATKAGMVLGVDIDGTIQLRKDEAGVDNITIEKNANEDLQVKERGLELKHFANQTVANAGKVLKVDTDGSVRLLKDTAEVDNVTIEKPNDILQVKERGVDLKHLAKQNVSDEGKVLKVDSDGIIKLLEDKGDIINVTSLPTNAEMGSIYRLTVDTTGYDAGIYAKLSSTANDWGRLDNVDSGLRHGNEFPLDAKRGDLFALTGDISEEKPKGLYIYNGNGSSSTLPEGGILNFNGDSDAIARWMLTRGNNYAISVYNTSTGKDRLKPNYPGGEGAAGIYLIRVEYHSDLGYRVVFYQTALMDNPLVWFSKNPLTGKYEWSYYAQRSWKIMEDWELGARQHEDIMILTGGELPTTGWYQLAGVEEGGGADPINVIDNLNSSSATDALSANQGKVLNENKVEKSKLAKIIYGTDSDGNEMNYGVDDAIDSPYASSMQVPTDKAVYDFVNDKAVLKDPTKRNVVLTINTSGIVEWKPIITMVEYYIGLKRSATSDNIYSTTSVITNSNDTPITSYAAFARWLYNNGWTSMTKCHPFSGILATTAFYVANASGGPTTTSMHIPSIGQGVFSEDGVNIQIMYRSGTAFDFPTERFVYLGLREIGSTF